ncbi:OPT oligopeptide transporter protein-domain-containing protein [Lactifluus subvellereus]|nr:OPT oligopeptide transporter protein-domain-containing protein [Lactifluus subvellereus]
MRLKRTSASILAAISRKLTMSLLEDNETPIGREKRDPEHLGSINAISLDDFDDPNFDPSAVIHDDESPYPEVRSAVANTDDPMVPSSTFRAWVVGIIWVVLMAGVNQLFLFRYPTVHISGFVPLLLTFPICKAWSHYSANVSLFGMSLNPGPFTIKEHVIITVMANVANESAYATHLIAVQRVFYNQHPNFVYQWLLVMSTQLIGFSIAGICKRSSSHHRL